MVACGSCGIPNPDGNRFCDDCGAPFSTCTGDNSLVVTFGREPENVIQSPPSALQVGRYHARFVLEGGQWFLEDLGSQNGSIINGQRVYGRAPLTIYDEVYFGSYRFNTAELQPFASGASTLQGGQEESLPSSRFLPVVPGSGGPGAQLPAAALTVAVPPVNAAVPPPEVQIYGLRRIGKIREPILVPIFTILTLGFYVFYWYWVTLDDIRGWRDNQGWTGPMVLICLVPIVGIVAIALPFLIASYTGDLYRREERSRPVNGWYGLLLLVPIVGLFIYFYMVQDALNNYWRSKGAIG